MSKHNKNRQHNLDRAQSAVKDELHEAGAEIHEDIDNLKARGRAAVTDMKDKARNVADRVDRDVADKAGAVADKAKARMKGRDH